MYIYIYNTRSATFARRPWASRGASSLSSVCAVYVSSCVQCDYYTTCIQLCRFAARVITVLLGFVKHTVVGLWWTCKVDVLCDRGSPVKMQVKSLSQVKSSCQVRQVSAGSNHTVLLTSDGHVLTCGSNHVSSDMYSVCYTGQCQHYRHCHCRRSTDLFVSLVNVNIIVIVIVDVARVCLSHWSVSTLSSSSSLT